MVLVQDLMTADPVAITPDMALRNIIGLMKQNGFRQLPVVVGDKLVGIVTDRDVRLVVNSPMIVHDHEEDMELLDEVTADGCMTLNPITVTADMPASRAAEMLAVYKFGALPVVDGDRLVGIITVTDFLNAFVAGEEKREISAFEY
jgi:acetoin utilization protein AcuB